MLTAVIQWFSVFCPHGTPLGLSKVRKVDGTNYEPEEIDAAIYYINKLGMNDWLDKCCDGLNTYINEKSDNISGGEKQKLSIIRELLKKPLVLLLDEPTSAMDADSINTFFELLNAIKNDTIIIIATHDSRALHYCDSIVPLK